MRPYRTLLSLISSVVLCMVVWTSDVHALSILVENLNTSNNAVLNSTTINFTSITAAPGCLTGYACNRISNWPTAANPPGNAGFILNTPTTGTPWLRITTNPGYTSGPIASVLNSPSSASFGVNGMIFQGFNSGAGRLRITLSNNFSALTNGTRTYGFMENGNFLQPGGNVSGDTLTMQGTVDTTIFPATAILKTAGTGTSFPYNFNLSPTTAITTTIAGGTDLKYTWVYNYNNTSGPITSAFSDPAGVGGGFPACPPTSQNPACSTLGGVGVYLASDEDLPGILQTLSGGTGVSLAVPEPSSVLLLGLGLLSGGIFFASRLRKEKERETR